MSTDPSKPEKKRTRAYCCWPFASDKYNDAELVQSMMLKIMHKGIAPIIAAPYIVSTNFWSFDLAIIHATIAGCDVVFLFLENHATEQMMAELMYAKSIGKPVVRITDFPKGG